MDEFKFVVKSFLIALCFLAVSQIRTGDNSTVELQINASLRSSNVTNMVNGVASGGVKVIKEVYAFSVSKFKSYKIQKNEEASPANEQIKDLSSPEERNTNQNKRTTNVRT